MRALVLQVHRRLKALVAVRHLEDLLDLRLGQLDGEQAVLLAVGAENLCKPGCDHRAKPVLLDRPDRVLPA